MLPPGQRHDCVIARHRQIGVNNGQRPVFRDPCCNFSAAEPVSRLLHDDGVHNDGAASLLQGRKDRFFSIASRLSER